MSNPWPTSWAKLALKFGSIRILPKIAKSENHTKNKHIMKEIICQKSGSNRV